MSTKDKTRDKLMSSMRKTKAAVEGSKPPRKVNEEPASEKTTAAVKNKTTVASKPAKSSAANDITEAVDSYQTAKRVWPD